MESATLTCGDFKVEFHKRGDRYRHQIARYLPDATGGLLISREGTSDDNWPPSPALQSLHLETRPGGIQTALLVGTAGRCHWSMSVVADPSKNRLLFDVACRIHDPPDWLGSIYDAVSHSAGESAFNYLKLEPSDIKRNFPGCQVQIDELNGTVHISPFIPSDGGSQTIRWSYSVELAVDT